MNAVAEVLAKARDVLAERGWLQGDFDDPDTGAVCAWGAISVAATGQPMPLTENTEACRLGLAAYEHLNRYTMREFGRGAHQWNDRPSTTAEDVFLALKHAEELALETA